ncbi:hypothetical protein SAMN04489712_11056 [Thermomonospora echinospora]|uniref:Lipoprotein n=2 Tax=Thermomonospora echinospora TaxID=1992 RepID=A0A1H6CJ69_9ACTN|nr:hypothetical protein SAMN04489712_11056 [Thermomonospora echinospora]
MFHMTYRSVFALGLAAVLLLSACGGSEDDAPSGGGPGGMTVNTDELVEFAECLRGQGIDVPDPKPGQNLANWLSEENRAELRDSRAVAACEDKLPSAVKDRMKDPELQNRLLRFAQCMRDNGVDMPDPKNGRLDFDAIDRDAPNYQEAAGKCRETLGGR